MHPSASSQKRSVPTPPGADRRSLFFSSSLKAGVLVIRPTGPNLGQREAAIINSEVRPMIEDLGKRLRTMVLDLSDVHGMASFGLGVCIELRNAAHAAKARTIVFGLNEELTAMFRLMKVERLYTIVQSTDELSSALAA
jgi:anti-anti-sigma factor